MSEEQVYARFYNRTVWNTKLFNAMLKEAHETGIVCGECDFSVAAIAMYLDPRDPEWNEYGITTENDMNIHDSMAGGIDHIEVIEDGKWQGVYIFDRGLIDGVGCLDLSFAVRPESARNQKKA